MKKILFSVLAAISALSAFAQADTAYAKEATSLKYKTEPNRFGVEAGINLKDGFSINGGLINANYTLTENLTARLGFGLSVDKIHKHDNVTVEGIEADTHADTMSTKFYVLPGIAYSFKGTERLEPYVGAELVFGFDKNRLRNNAELSGSEGYTLTSKTTDTDLFFGANGFTGFKFYLCKDLYVGAELKFGFTTTPDHIHNEDIEDSTIDPVDEKEDDSKHFKHETNIDLHFRPTLTLGWKF